MEFRGNTYTCKSCGSPMAGDFSNEHKASAHCMNEHCDQFNLKKLLPDNSHRPDPRHHVQPIDLSLAAEVPSTEDSGDQK
jgi:hypothetical protein